MDPKFNQGGLVVGGRDSWTWWYTPVILETEDQEFKVSLTGSNFHASPYMRLYIKKTKKGKVFIHLE